MNNKKLLSIIIPTLTISLLLFLFIKFLPTSFRWQDQLSFMILVFVISKFILQTTVLWHISRNTQGTIKILVCSLLMALCSIPSIFIGFILSGYMGADSLNVLLSIILAIMLICDIFLAYLILGISRKNIWWVIAATVVSVFVAWFYGFLDNKINHQPQHSERMAEVKNRIEAINKILEENR